MGKQRRPYNWSNSMLTTDDRDEIKRLVAEMMEPGRKRGGLRFDESASSSAQANYAEEIDQIVIVNDGLTELTLVNPKTGERLVLSVAAEPDSLVEVTARGIEVFGTREKALRWLRTPVRALGGQTPMSLLKSPEGLARVQDALGQVEHGVW